ncbi:MULTISPECIES: hypothetical protein [Streptomyces]|uniref:Lipoprotein n=1 Tax=Streptomyces sudanensis TaxID=436397 RepID=A0ABY4T840_9ACTN|nr:MULTISPECIES: hypothetical protein [Streptomyces]MCP9986337.1 hypothetical protein [Streptomyces sudanensis]URN14872.1 hypothetical protein MW084_01845 [Streptomyces sudanensis]
MTASAVLATMLLTGCGVLNGKDENRGKVAAMDMQQAAERADAMLDGTLKAIVPEVEWVHDTTTVGSCDLSRRRTVMTIISEQRRGSFLGVVERFWKNSDYRIIAVNDDKEAPAVYADSPDGFGISLVFGYKGQAFFEVATPCVRESEVADSKSPPNGPSYPPGQIPIPNVRSPFWSAGTPAPPSVRPTSAAQPSPSS